MYTYIKFNTNDQKSIKAAEKMKLMFENKGYILAHEFINSITGECTFTYKTN